VDELSVCSIGEMILTGHNGSTRRKIYSSATLSTCATWTSRWESVVLIAHQLTFD